MKEQMEMLLNILKKSQHSSIDEILQKQQNHLEAIIKHAKSSTKFYNKLYKNIDKLEINYLPIDRKSVV